MTLNYRVYSEVRDEIQDADILLFRSRGLIWRIIGAMGRSEFTHVGMAGWWNGRLMNVEMTSGGGRAMLLSNVVDQWPGIIDVYETNADHRQFSRARALNAMIELTGKPYGKLSVLRVSAQHAPVLRFFIPTDTNDLESTSLPPYCSQAISLACRDGGADPVPTLADRLTEPADLSRSTFFGYRFTLVTESYLKRKGLDPKPA